MKNKASTKLQPRARPGGRSARVREAVVAATVAELEEVGYAKLSIPAVAAQAGVHETSIYRRWKTRERLVIEATFALFAKSIVVVDRGSLVEDLLAILVALGLYLKTPLGTSAVQLTSATGDDPDVARVVHEQWAIRFQTVQQVFDRAIARGEWPPDVDPLPSMQCMIGVVYLRVLMLKAPVTRAHLRPLIEGILQLRMTLPGRIPRRAKGGSPGQARR